MTTLVVRGRSAKSREFLELARSLPFVEIIEENGEPVKKLKPAVERSIRRSMHGKDLVAFDNIDDMFKDLDI